MNELHDLLGQALAADEPPIGPLFGNAVKAARKARRRRLVAGIGAVAAIVPAVAFGVPALAGALAPAGGHRATLMTPDSGRGGTVRRAVEVPNVVGMALSQAQALMRAAGFRVTIQASSTPGPAGTVAAEVPQAGTRVSAGSAVTMQVVPAAAFTFVRPTMPTSYPDANPVPITNQSIGQLLIDDLPAGAQMSQIEASADANAGQAGVVYRTADAWFNDVTTRIGSGTVQADMMAVGAKPFDFICPPSPGCRNYSLPGGVKVTEQYDTGTVAAGPHTGQQFVQLAVAVFRANVAEMDVMEGNSAMAAGSPVTKGMPLTLEQMLKIALDSRWQFTISQSFVQHASGLHVAPLDTSGS